MPIQRAKPIAADIPVINNTSLPTGSILQAKSTTLEGGTANGVTVTAGNYADTGLSLTITPTNSNSIMHIHVTFGAESLSGTANKGSHLRLVKNSTNVETQLYNTYTSNLNAQVIHTAPLHYVDDHNGTAAITYKLQVGSYGASSRSTRYASTTMIIYEIAG